MNKKAVLLVIFLGCLLQAFPQQEYFILIHHEKSQPFYVRMGERTYSSSAIGHLILPRLKDSTYNLAIGFPNNLFPEQEYVVRINKNDKGFELKNMADKGWNLFDTRSMELIAPVQKPVRNNSSGGAAFIKRNDDFAKLMSGVVNDTAVLYLAAVEKKPAPVAVVKKEDSSAVAGIQQKKETVQEEKKADPPVQESKRPDSNTLVQTVPEPKKTDTAALVNSSPETKKKDTLALVNTPEPKADSSALVKSKPASDKTDTSASVKTKPEPANETVFNPPALPVISVVREYASDTGYHMVMMDAGDSISIFIPADAKDLSKTAKPDTKVADKTAEESKTVASENRSVTDNQARDKAIKDSLLKQDAPSRQETIKKEVTPKQEVSRTDNTAKPDNQRDIASEQANNPRISTDSSKKSKLVMINSDCRAFASNNDLDKLRVKLIQEKDAEARIAAAKKVFRTRCFSAAQIKALSELFPYDEQKYQFLEAAYPFVSDTSVFKELVSLLNDPSYVQKFRKLVRLD